MPLNGKIDGKWYYFGSDGVMRTGWVKIGKTKYYYVPETGKLANGIVVINGTPYSFKNGIVSKSASSGVSGGKYYIRKSDGSYVTGKGWTYYNGYKYYFEDDGYSIRMDTESLLTNELKDPHGVLIRVNKSKCQITVYAYDKATGEYCIPVRSFVCSTGQRTPLTKVVNGKKVYFELSNANRWVRLVGPTEDTYTYGQWGMRYDVGINDDGSESKRYFHSVYYDQNPKDADPKNPNYDILAEKFLNVRAWNMLGKVCSHGCIRLETKNVNWIYKKLYKNKDIKVYVDIYESSVAGPYGKMSAVKLPSWHTWDPTDPNMKYKCQEKGCHNY